ncbi:hypothetical protein ABKN59_005586 [Abortiporus biennis]
MPSTLQFNPLVIVGAAIILLAFIAFAIARRRHGTVTPTRRNFLDRSPEEVEVPKLVDLFVVPTDNDEDSRSSSSLKEKTVSRCREWNTRWQWKDIMPIAARMASSVTPSSVPAPHHDENALLPQSRNIPSLPMNNESRGQQVLNLEDTEKHHLEVTVAVAMPSCDATQGEFPHCALGMTQIPWHSSKAELVLGFRITIGFLKLCQQPMMKLVVITQIVKVKIKYSIAA